MPNIIAIYYLIAVAILQCHTIVEGLQYVWIHPIDQADLPYSWYCWFVCFP